MTKLTEGWKSKERKIRLKKGIMRMLSFSCYLLLFVFVKKKKKKLFMYNSHTYGRMIYFTSENHDVDSYRALILPSSKISPISAR